jgi:hypothetical protein
MILALKTILTALICLGLTLPSGALSRWVDEGEFSAGMLARKLHLLNCQFEQTERQLSMRTGVESKHKKRQDVHAKVKYSETRFRRGKYYPDLLDEQVVILRERLRLIMTGLRKGASPPQPET